MSADRLSLWRAAFVIARRDFTAVLFGRAFLFFLLGPLFPVVVAGMAGGVGQKIAQETRQPEIGVAMETRDVDAMLAAYVRLAPRLGGGLPGMVVMKRLEPGEAFDAAAALRQKRGNIAAIVIGTPASPELVGPQENIARWSGPLSLVAAAATGEEASHYPEIALKNVAVSAAKERSSRAMLGQMSQMLLFLLTMLLAGMVLSNLVEEKGNKIIEILAAAVPMDAVFLGKLLAMLGVSLVGIMVWGGLGGSVLWLGRAALPEVATPAVGWPVFLALGVLYFAMAYLLLGSIFLAIGSLAATVREVQTLSMPVTMAQVLVFFFASYALAQPGSLTELAAIAFPLSSPFVMLARGARDASLWPHAAALGWQAFCVALFIRTGAGLFRRHVMQSGSRGQGAAGGRRFRRRAGS
jgi:ABC-2 type transport system permease protein